MSLLNAEKGKIMNNEIRNAPKKTIAVILAGGRGTRLKDLTDDCAKPAVHFGGKYRIIDFALSNCVNSGFRRISVLTQYKAHSLIRHIQHGWNFLRGEMGEYVDIIPAQQRVDEESWYQGTADAVYQNIDIFKEHRANYVLVLAGDHVYKMDYAALLADHITKGADVTIPCIEVPRKDATGFGVVHVDDQDRITEFLEKPADPPGIPDNPDMAFASMGIYVFNADFLYRSLEEDALDKMSGHDFGKNIIPGLISDHKVVAHRFQDSCVRSHPDAASYWRDVGTVDAYWEANMDLTKVTPQLDCYDAEWPIFSTVQHMPPAKFVFNDTDRRGEAHDSVVASGAIISGSTITRSLLSYGAHVHSYCNIKDTVLLPYANIGRGCRISKAIIEEGCDIPPDTIIGEDAKQDSERFLRTEKGVVLVTRKMVEKLEKSPDNKINRTSNFSGWTEQSSTVVGQKRVANQQPI
jgi:glucose-1-phosphate adenylyltransferase